MTTPQLNLADDKANTSLYHDQELLALLNTVRRQPPELRDWRRAEAQFVRDEIFPKSRVIDFCCGDGFHLRMIEDLISHGLGIDFDASTIEYAKAVTRSPLIRFLKTDAKAPNILIDTSRASDHNTIASLNENPDTPNQSFTTAAFDTAICLFNSIANIQPMQIVHDNMKQMLASGGTTLVSVYSEKSIDVRLRWYEQLGLGKARVCDDHIETEGS
jgi:SAM-dependent methyltransferase